jgi:hypothetical protein
MKKFLVTLQVETPDSWTWSDVNNLVVTSCREDYPPIVKTISVDVVQEDEADDDVDPSNGVPLQGVDNGPLVEEPLPPGSYTHDYDGVITEGPYKGRQILPSPRQLEQELKEELSKQQPLNLTGPMRSIPLKEEDREVDEETGRRQAEYDAEQNEQRYRDTRDYRRGQRGGR